MKKTIWSILLLCLLISAGCSEKPAGTLEEGNVNVILLGDTRYLYDTIIDRSQFEQGERIGTASGNGRKFEIYTVQNDGNREYLYVLTEDQTERIYVKESLVREMEKEVKTVCFDGKEMDYIRFGSRSGPTLVILPGLSLKSVMGSAAAIIQAYQILAKDYDILLMDRIREIPQGCDMQAMAEDTEKALQELHVSPSFIMGVSQGGMIGLHMAMDRYCPGGLILCSASSRIGEESAAVLGEWKRLAQERNLPALMETFGEYVYTPSFYEQYKEIITASGSGASEQDYENFIRSIDGMIDFDVYDRLEEIHCPVYVLGAGEDRILGAQASRDLMEKLHCDGYIYEGYGHGVYDEAPDYLERIGQFLAGISHPLE